MLGIQNDLSCNSDSVSLFIWCVISFSIELMELGIVLEASKHAACSSDPNRLISSHYRVVHSATKNKE